MDRSATPLILCGILLLALLLRAVTLDGQSFFVDEISELVLSKKPLAKIVVAPDSAPPFFPLALKNWLTFWRTDAAARWLSLICGLASIVCVWAIGRRLVDNATGLAAAFVLAILPMHVFYSQFVRSYSLLFLLVALALWLLLRAVESDSSGDWIAFVGACLLGAYTHYYFAIFVATSVLVVCLRRSQWWIGRRAFVAYACIGIAALPLLILLKSDLHFQKSLRDPRSLDIETFGYTYFSLFSGYTLGPSTTELQTMPVKETIAAAAPWIAAIGIVLATLGYYGVRRLHERSSLAIVLVLLLVPVFLLGALSYAVGLNYNVRFVTWISIAAALGLGAGIVQGGRSWPARLALAALVIISTTALYNRNLVPRYQNEDLRGAAAFIRGNAAPAGTVYIVSDYLADVARYYLGDGWKIVELPQPGEVNQVVEDRTAAERAVAATILESPSDHPIWLVYSRPFHGDPHGLLLKELQDRHLLAKQSELAGVTIYRGD